MALAGGVDEVDDHHGWMDEVGTVSQSGKWRPNSQRQQPVNRCCKGGIKMSHVLTILIAQSGIITGLFGSGVSVCSPKYIPPTPKKQQILNYHKLQKIEW